MLGSRACKAARRKGLRAGPRAPAPIRDQEFAALVPKAVILESFARSELSADMGGLGTHEMRAGLVEMLIKDLPDPRHEPASLPSAAVFQPAPARH